ncbi:alpha/beta fold hydrolase [Chryseobacterium populi]|uniref:Putative hydrolase or acyltransferase of alpha/beta superfamily n=1 Tax=Chryseobacterium populi TaxID=1144316 RepID=J2T6K6_9FLAO|nr:alpha/beta hydrolase [Chryseobacterium populi]EJL73667.1 putative hydrolase or acyltransferase of alpha/beta superfamily [Chryseobacterium populi]
MYQNSTTQDLRSIRKYLISSILILIFSMGLNAQQTKSSLGTLKQIDAGVLNIGYTEAGSPTGTPVILLHGWPYDIHSYENVVPLLTAKGYRVITPYLRGFGTTRFISDKTIRNGQQSAVALDIIALMDALKIDKAIIGGFDWGARTADVIAVLWPERVKRLVSVSGYLITNLEANKKPLPPAAESGWWYQYYFSTARGEKGYNDNRYEFNKLIWKTASPLWNFHQATYDQTAQSFNNPDHVAIVIHNYRWRLSLAKGETKYDELEKKLSTRPVITVPTITISSDFDGAAIDGKAYANQFTGKYSHKILHGIGHNVPQEDPKSFADAIIEVDGYSK